jgi:hypothetical protein
MYVAYHHDLDFFFLGAGASRAKHVDRQTTAQEAILKSDITDSSFSGIIGQVHRYLDRG